MQYKRIITIREGPIRRNLEDLGETEELAIQIGRAVLGITAEAGYDGPLKGLMSEPMPFYRERDVFVPVRSVRTDQFGVFAWTGNRLGVVGCDGPEALDVLTGISYLCGWGHVLRPDLTDYLSDSPRARFTDEPEVIASIWSVDQSETSQLAAVDPESWPVRTVGASVLWQMRRQEDVRREVGAMHRTGPSQWVRKCFDITSNVFASFVWEGTLRRQPDSIEGNDRKMAEREEVRAAWIRDGDEFGTLVHHCTFECTGDDHFGASPS